MNLGFRRNAHRNGRRPLSSTDSAVTRIASMLGSGLILVAANNDRPAHLRPVMAEFRANRVPSCAWTLSWSSEQRNDRRESGGFRLRSWNGERETKARAAILNNV
ncbi:MAG: hypothetical protein AB7S93_10535 [Xanthobacteraceae bacterium]